MARITKYDSVRGCYVIEPDNNQNHIQRLGELEDRDEAKEVIYEPFDAEFSEDIMCYRCSVCKERVEGDDGFPERSFAFCPFCGHRLKWGDDDSND